LPEAEKQKNETEPVIKQKKGTRLKVKG